MDSISLDASIFDIRKDANPPSRASGISRFPGERLWCASGAEYAPHSPRTLCSVTLPATRNTHGTMITREWPENPTDNWGPKARAKKRAGEPQETNDQKRRRLQGHRTVKAPRKDVPCRLLARDGECRFGDSCRYSHTLTRETAKEETRAPQDEQ